MSCSLYNSAKRKFPSLIKLDNLSRFENKSASSMIILNIMDQQTETYDNE